MAKWERGVLIKRLFEEVRFLPPLPVFEKSSEMEKSDKIARIRKLKRLAESIKREINTAESDEAHALTTAANMIEEHALRVFRKIQDDDFKNL